MILDDFFDLSIDSSYKSHKSTRVQRVVDAWKHDKTFNNENHSDSESQKKRSQESSSNSDNSEQEKSYRKKRKRQKSKKVLNNKKSTWNNKL